MNSVTETAPKSLLETADHERAWQQSTSEVAWGTIALFFGVLLGYAVVCFSVLNGYLNHWLAVPICAYLTYASFTVLHDAGHGGVIAMGSRFKPLEDVMGWIASLPFLIVPYRFFQKIHDRHHAFTNDPERDPDHYPFGDRWYEVALGCLWLPFEYYRLALTQYREVPTIRNTWKSSAIYLSIVVAGIVTLIMTGFGKELLFLVVLPAILAVFALALFFDYLPHHPRKSRGRYQDTRIYPSRVLNALLLGQNYHLIHHLYPRLPWYQYEGLYHRILPELEANGAPIERVWGDQSGRPDFMTSPKASGLMDQGTRVHHMLRVSDITRYGKHSVVIRFELPSINGVIEPLSFRPGQYLTVSKWLSNRYVSRCYSICSTPESPYLEIGVKAVEHGLLSNYLVNNLSVGDELSVEGPHGDFFDPSYGQSTDSQEPSAFKEPSLAKQSVGDRILISAGSGITPMMSMARSALLSGKSENNYVLHFVHCARSVEEMMFFSEIEVLAKQYPERLKLDLYLSGSSDSDYSASKYSDRNAQSSQVTFHHRRMTRLDLEQLLAQSVEPEVFVCGPTGVQDMVIEAAEKAGVAGQNVHREIFELLTAAPAGERFKVTINVLGDKETIEIAENQTLLDAALDANIQLTHACRSGTCGSCKCKIETGQFSAEDITAPGISDRELAEGYRLACQAKPLSDASVSAL